IYRYYPLDWFYYDEEMKKLIEPLSDEVYLIKPYLSREGDGVHLDYECSYNQNDDVIFQNRVNIKPIKMELHSVSTKENKYQFPILGAYITNDKFSGIYTRMGDIITDKNARYISTYIK
ncbi:glutathionylspermidine synthase, partial [Clostridium botulinum]|nr:glutathionylspermidine synthase [Clostridium botulinum]